MRQILTYVTYDHGHVRICEISKDEGLRLIDQAGLWDECVRRSAIQGDCLVNKFAVQVDPARDLWVYNHDGRYFITAPKLQA